MAVLLLGVGLTVAATTSVGQRLDLEARAEFDRLVERIAVETQRRMNVPVYGLKGARGLYAASEQVGLSQFKAFVASRNLPLEFPGIRGFGFIERVAYPDAPDRFVRRFIEPASGNEGALGFDVGSEPTRRLAIESAIMSGEPTLTGRISLLQDKQHRPGFLYYVPVYRAGVELDTEEDRWRSLRGVLETPIVAEEILAGVVDAADHRLDFEVFDGSATNAANLVFDFDGHLAPLAGQVQAQAGEPARRFEALRSIAVGGRALTLHASTLPAFDAAFDRSVQATVAAAGMSVTLLAAFAAWLLAAGRARIAQRARELTTDLDRLAKVVERTSNTVLITDREHRIVWVNEGFTRISGYSADEAIGRHPAVLLGGGKTALAALEALHNAASTSSVCRVEVIYRAKDQREFWLDIELQPTRDEQGELTGFIEVGTDITALKQTEQRLEAARDEAAAMAADLDLMAKVARYTSNAVVVSDAQRRIRWVNEGFTRITGYSAAEAMGRSPAEMLQCEHTGQGTIARMREALTAGRSFHGELLNRGKNGQEYWIDIELQPLRAADGSLNGFMAIESDVTERKAASEALARERARLGHILDGTNAGDGEWNVQTGEFLMSPRWAGMFGYTLEDLAPVSVQTWVQRVHPDDVPLFSAALQAHLRGETPQIHQEIRMRHRDGRWLAIDIRGRVSSHTADGRAEWISGTHIDVTETRRAAQRWQARAELSGDWFWQTDPGHRFNDMTMGDRVRAVTGSRSLTGLRRDEIEWFDAPEGGWAALHALMDRHEPFAGTCYASHADPAMLRWIEIDGRPRFDEDGVFLGYEGVGRDVSERRRVTENLRSSLALIDALFEGIPVPVVMKDAQCRYVRMNKAYSGLFGLQAADVLGKRAGDLISPEAAARHDAEDQQLLESPGTCAYEVTQELKGGRRLDALVCKSTLLGPGGQVLGLVGTMVDISQQKAAQRAMAEAKDAAEDANRAKSAFLATMSHEIRTPMNGVLGMAELLAHSDLDEEQAQTVRTVRESAMALLRLIDDILDFSKIEAGRLELDQAPVLLTPLAEGLCDALASVASGKQVGLHLFIEPGTPEQVLADSGRVRQLLNNLVGNAIKFSAGRAEQPGRVSLRIAPDGDGLRFAITDNGIGMDEGTLARLFTPFTQAEVSTTRRFGGTGLGLAICKRLAELMDGRIDVTSTPGVGSTFAVWLPLHAVGEQPKPALADLSGLDCVIVSHDDLPADDLAVWLAHAGALVHRVATAADGATAAAAMRPPVVLIQAERPDGRTVLPEAHGFDLRHLLVGRGRRGHARVVAPNAAALDMLRRASFLSAVAMLAGRESPEVAPPRAPDLLAGTRVQAPTVAQARRRGQLILVAEDDSTNRAVITRQLALLGHAAEVAEDGALALQMWREGRHALLLTDLHMPALDGYALAQAIRSEEAERGLVRMPILALTANALTGEALRARAAGMDDYLTKPVPVRLLHAALGQWMPAPHTEPAPAHPGPASHLPADTRVLDLDVLRKLVGDDEATVHELLADFLASAKEQAQALRTAFRDGDLRHVAAIAHKLKSGSRSVGAVTLGELCAELERQPSTTDPQAVLPKLTLFDSTFGAVVAHIESHFGALQP